MSSEVKQDRKIPTVTVKKIVKHFNIVIFKTYKISL